MARFAAVCVLYVLTCCKNQAGCLKQMDSVQMIQTEQPSTDSSSEIYKQSSRDENVQSDTYSEILRSIRSLSIAFENEQRLNNKKYYKLKYAISSLAKDVNTLKKDKTQNIAEGQDMLQRLEDMNKHQEETRVQIAALGQKVDDVLKENEQFMATQKHSIVANLEKIEGLEQRVKDVKLDILTNVDDVLAKAEENHTNKYEALIQEAVDSREKCQSGDPIGPHSGNPSFPSNETVWFQPPFKNTPSLVYGLKVLDSYAYTNVRFYGVITELTNTHFNLTVNKWSDTVMWGARFSWMACP